MAAEVEETLAREEQGRGRAGTASILAGVFTLAGGVISTIVSQSLPGGAQRVLTLLPALQRSLQGEPLPQGVLAQQVDWIGRHLVVQTAGGVLVGLAALLTLIPLRFLYQAAAARAPGLGRGGIVAAVAGALLAGVGFLVYTVAFSVSAAQFTDARVQTSTAARDAISGSAVQAATLLYQLGRFGLALGFVMISLNAMRLGLLTRFFGILGIIAGVLFVLPVDQPGIVRSFFLIAVGLLLLGRWMGGVPPAWRTGRAERWPTQQELRERREAARRGEPPEPELDDQDVSGPAPVPSGNGPHPSSKRRKRKRRA